MSRDAIDEIKRRLDLRTLVAETTQLKGSGAQRLGLCPFHGDKHPSLSVTSQVWVCRAGSCARGGDALTWLMELGWSFHDALVELAGRTGVELPERRGPPGPSRDDLGKLAAATTWAATWYRSQLSTTGRDYLARRRISAEVIDTFGLGEAPPTVPGDKRWTHLTDAAGAHLEAVKALGLSVPTAKDPSRFIDALRSRLICPIRNLSGRVVGFSGRDLSGRADAPKYVNSRESALFRKGGELFGLYEARRAIKTEQRAIVVEGNVDVLAMHSAGLTCTVAPCGTAFTTDQAAQIARAVGPAGQVLVIPDGDRAGRTALTTWLPELLVHDVDVMVCELPDGQDPADLWCTGGREAIDDVLVNAQAGVEVLVRALCPTGATSTPAAKTKLARELRPMLARCTAPMRQATFEAAARHVGVSPNDFEAWVLDGTDSDPGERADGKKPEIVVAAGQLEAYTRQAALALKARHPTIFSRAKMVVRVDPAGTIHAVDVAELAPLLEGSATWVKEMVDRRSREVTRNRSDVPARTVTAIAAGSDRDVLQTLDAVVDVPYLRPSMDVVSTPGYDPATRILLVGKARMAQVPDTPTGEHVAAAFARLAALYQDFPFVTPADQSAAMAALFSCVCRPAFDLCPMFAFDAPKQGTGKTKLIEVAAIVATGAAPNGMPLRRDPDKEWRDIEGMLLSGQRLLVFDNQHDDSTFDNPNMERMLTGLYTPVRPFSSNTIQEVRNVQVVMMSANNVSFRAGMVRRTVVCRLDANMESPQFRTGWAIPRLLEHVHQHRQQLAADVLTLVRAAYLAGAQEGGKGPSPLGSFEQWDAVVRRTLLWMGLADPIRTTVDPDLNTENARLMEFLLAWKEAFGFEPITVRTLVGDLSEREAGSAKDVIAGALDSKRRLSLEIVGKRIKRYLRKPCSGLVLEQSFPNNRSTLTLQPHGASPGAEWDHASPVQASSGEGSGAAS